MDRFKRNKLIATGLWVLLLAMLAPTIVHLATYASPESEMLACYPAFNPAYYDSDAYAEAYELNEQVFRAGLADSPVPEAQVLGLLAEANGRVDNEDIQSLAQLAEQFPESGFVLAELISACFNDGSSDACTDRALSAAVGSQHDNGIIWAELAMLRASRDDLFGANQALQRAINAADFDDYFSLQIAVLDSAALEQEPMSKLTTGFRSFRYADTSIGYPIDYSPSHFCAEHVQDNPLIAESCLGYGERLAAEADTTLGRLIGYAIQEVTFQALGNSEAVTRMQLAASQQRDINYDSARSSYSHTGLMSYDESLAEFWLQSLIDNGEPATLGIMSNEIDRRLADPAYRPCEPPGIRFEYPYFYFGEQRVIW